MSDSITRLFPHLLHDWGYIAVALAVVADSFGLPVPGEVMLMLAAVYAGATHHLALPAIIAAAVVGAILGDNTTYQLGRRGGYPLIKRHGKLLHLDDRRLQIGEYLFRRFGEPVVWVGRMVPVLHIWTALLAGVNRMAWWRFALANAIGAAVWATVLSLIGYAFGKTALHFGAIMAGAAVPVAILIGLGVILLLRANERRLYQEARKSEDSRANHVA
jgi:membrane protein DedA with SNARE-associated domain